MDTHLGMGPKGSIGQREPYVVVMALIWPYHELSIVDEDVLEQAGAKNMPPENRP